MAARKRTTRISHRHALDSDELMFVRIFVAFGKQNAAEAYRRAYLAKNEEGNWFLRDKKGDPRLDKPVDANTASKKATALLKQDHIAGYIAELDQGAGDAARQTLTDAVLFTDDQLSLKAAEKVLADEDKLGFRDAVELWAEVMCALGTEVVLAVDGAEVVVPLKAMFPQYADAIPPLDVLDKTIRTLEAYRAARAEADQG